MIPVNYNYDPEFRRRQIDTLKIFNDNVLQIKENEEYTVTFLSGERVITVTVVLGPNFPNEKPRILVSPPLVHPWFRKSSGEIENAPGLLNYTPHSDLGRIVQAIIREFEKFPPALLSDNQTNVTANEPQKVQCSFTSIDHKFREVSPPTACDLSELSIDELNRLNTDSVFLEDFVQETDILRALHNELDKNLVQVQNISKENLSKENYLNNLKTKLNADFAVLKELGEKYTILNLKYEKKSAEFAPEHLQELLQIGSSNAESECEKHVSEFLSQKIDIQTFLTCYTETKKKYAIQKAKEERLGQQLKESGLKMV